LTPKTLAHLAGEVIVFGLLVSIASYPLSARTTFGRALLVCGVTCILAGLFMRALAVAKSPPSRERTTRHKGPRIVVEGSTVETTEPHSSIWDAYVSPVEASHGAATSLRPTQWDAKLLAAIEWRRFEILVEALFNSPGFSARSQSFGPDGGVDVWVHRDGDEANPWAVVQCKHWRNRLVGVDKIRELYGVMAAHSVRRGFFVTSSEFSAEAKNFAATTRITLVDGEMLLKKIAALPEARRTTLLNIVLQGEYWRPTCVNCGVKMVRRTDKSGRLFWGCQGYPRCKTRLPLAG